MSDPTFAPGENGNSGCGTKFACMIIGGLGNSRSLSMSTQIVMDHTGDRRHQFDPKNTNELAEAEKRFKELTGLGFTAAERTKAGETMKVISFDPTAQETVFFPRLVGG
jgi:hypothetical protein